MLGENKLQKLITNYKLSVPAPKNFFLLETENEISTYFILKKKEISLKFYIAQNKCKLYWNKPNMESEARTKCVVVKHSKGQSYGSYKLIFMPL